MKKIVITMVAIFVFLLTACGDDSSVDSVEERKPVQYSYVADMNSMESVIEYSTNIVKAKLLATEDFNGYVNQYHFAVLDDYTENTPDDIYMYDAYNNKYVIGHTYYLFLCGTENALYPHTVFTTVLKDLIIDTSSTKVQTRVNSSDIVVQTAEIGTIISSAVQGEIVGRKAEQAATISNSSNLTTVSETADVVAEICVSEEQQANEYASTYKVQVLALLKGPKSSIAQYMVLPPGLSSNTTYYIFLVEDPENDNVYLLSSHVYPVVEVSDMSTSAVLVD